jgi:hypothetical protein
VLHISKEEEPTLLGEDALLTSKEEEPTLPEGDALPISRD